MPSDKAGDWEPGLLGTISNYATNLLCDLVLITQPFASVYPLCKMGVMQNFTEMVKQRETLQ